MKRTIAILTLVAGALFVAQGVTAAAPGIGQGPCHHGNSNKPCREDPQPTHGKDCQVHGKNGGLNQDHCLSGGGVEPTPTPTPSEPSVLGVTKHRNPAVAAGALARTGPERTSVFFGAALILLGLGAFIRTFDRKRILQS